MLDNRNIKSILVIKMRNIGDVLLTTPVFANLRAYFPQARICALVNSGTDAMLAGTPSINQVFVYERSVKNTSFMSRIFKEFKFLRKLRAERFDMVINLTDGDRGAIVALTSGAKHRIGVTSFNRGLPGKDKIFTKLAKPLPDGAHTVEQNLELLVAAGIPALHKQVSFYFSETDCAETKKLLSAAGIHRRYFHAHIVSRWMFKSMPATVAAMMIDMVSSKTGLTAVLTAAPVEKELSYLRTVLEACTSSPVDLSGQLSLKQMGALTSGASFFVGVDSAPMHIAAALDIPVLGVFGPSSATSWGPWDNSLAKTPYLQTRGIQATGRHVVLQSSKPCVPCHRDGCNGSKISDCLEFSLDQMELAVSVFLKCLQSPPDRHL